MSVTHFAPRTSDSGRRTQRGNPGPWTADHGLFLGFGRVNQAVAACLVREHDRLAEFGVEILPARALVRDLAKPRGGPSVDLTNDAAELYRTDVDIVVEAIGGVEPARSLVTAALEAGLPVVSANKTLVAAHGPELRAIAAAHATTFACDAAVLAGVPFLGSLSRRPLVSAATRIEAILNGTSHFVLSAIACGASFETAVARAVELGYAEADSTADISGRDAAEKLTILLHLAGREDVRTADLRQVGLDTLRTNDLDAARRLGGTIKPVALADLSPDRSGAWVGPAFVADCHPFARLDGVINALRLTTAAGCCTFSGPGAGPAVTAATIVDDIVEVLTNRGAFVPKRSPVRQSLARETGAIAAIDRPPTSGWFLRVTNASGLGAIDLAEYLAVRRVPAVRIDDHDEAFALVTAPAAWPVIADVVAAAEGCGARVLALPVLDGGEGE